MAFFKLPSESVRWLLAELSVVVIGILLAFQIEEWRNSLGDRELEKILLENMLSDIDAELTMLGSYSDFIEKNASSAIELLSVINSESPKDPENISSLWLNVTNEFRWRKTSPTYTGWRDSGRPDLVSDDELRGRLIRYHEHYLSFLEEASSRYQVSRLRVAEDSYEDFSYPFARDEESNRFRARPQLRLPVSEFPKSTRYLTSLEQYVTSASGLYNEIGRGIEIATEHKLLIADYLESNFEE